MYKHYGPADLDKMDLIEFNKAVEIAIASGMSKEIIEKIWSMHKDTSYRERMKAAREKHGL